MIQEPTSPVDLELLADEFDDPIRRLSNGFYKIVNEQGDLVPFRANWAQQRLLEELHDLNLILKARQLGFSTVIDLLGLDTAIWVPYTSVGIIAHTLVDVEKLFQSKVKTPWEKLHPDYRNRFGAKTDRANMLEFGNGSNVVVGMSLRSDTVQFLHISEYGKICAKFPDKAREVRTGALPALHAGGLGFIESTAEGQDGDFYNKSMKALADQERGRPLTSKSWKFHFFAWWQNPKYTLSKKEAAKVEINESMRGYFHRLREDHDIELTRGQKAWYVLTEEEQRGDMKREYPSFPEEAFEAAIEGAYYVRDMSRARREGRITTVPHDPRFPVHGAWDIGRNDSNAIWLFQDRPGGGTNLIGYLENNGEAMQWYGQHLQRLAQEREGWYYGTQYLPHDAEVTEYTRADGKTRQQVLEDMGFKTEVIPAVSSNAENGEGHQAVRDALPLCWFDAEGCSGRPRDDAEKGEMHTGGIEALSSYQKEWNEQLATFRDRPLHNWASHGAKAFETYARGHVNRVHASEGPGRRGRRRERRGSHRTA